MGCSEGFSGSVNISWEITVSFLHMLRFIYPNITYLTMKMTKKALRVDRLSF